MRVVLAGWMSVWLWAIIEEVLGWKEGCLGNEVIKPYYWITGGRAVVGRAEVMSAESCRVWGMAPKWWVEWEKRLQEVNLGECKGVHTPFLASLAAARN